MLKLEETVRLSKAYINKCSEVKDEVNGWLRVTGEVQETYDKTNAIPDQPPENLTDVSVYTTSGSNALKQNDLINEEKTDILFDDPSNNINPFGDW